MSYVVLGMLSGTLSFHGEDVFVGVLDGACNLAGTLLLLEGYRRGKVGVVTGMAATYFVPASSPVMTGVELDGPIISAAIAAGVSARLYEVSMTANVSSTWP